jgi:hypothetical protein
MSDKLRQTGRTTRMMQEAKRIAEAGRAVYVMAANEQHRRTLLSEFPDAGSLGIKVETPDSLPNFDWRRLHSPGAHPNCVFLVDHFAIESQFPALIEMLRRYER